MGNVNVIWQGDANEQALRLLAHCTAPTTPLNVTGPEKTQRALACARPSASVSGKQPLLHGTEAPSAWLIDTQAAQRLFGRRACRSRR